MTTLLFIAVGILGMIGHWFKRVGRNQMDCSLYDYIMVHKWYTVGAFLSTVGIILTTIPFNAGITQLTLTMAFTAGFAGDSLANKGPDQ